VKRMVAQNILQLGKHLHLSCLINTNSLRDFGKNSTLIPEVVQSTAKTETKSTSILYLTSQMRTEKSVLRA
jgi:hypothetical protein